MSTRTLLPPERRAAPAPVARVGLLGCGVVGSAVAGVLPDEEAVEMAAVAVLDPGKARPVHVPRRALTGDAAAVVDDPSVEVVVETIGGIDPARALVRRALAAGKSVVTANKELLARHGLELARAAESSGADLLFEGAVCGAIPIASALRGRLAWEPKRRVSGVVNGTTNFVLGVMESRGVSQEEAVAEAQRRGYAEADPAADLDGRDAAAKLAILASLAFGGWITADDVATEGIRGIEPADLRAARALGYAVKLFAEADAHGGAWVGPALVPAASGAGRTRGVANHVSVDCDVSGRLTFGGAGAGGLPTAGAVVADVRTAARNLLAGTRSPLVTAAGAVPRRAPSPEGRRRSLRRDLTLPVVEEGDT